MLAPPGLGRLRPRISSAYPCTYEGRRRRTCPPRGPVSRQHGVSTVARLVAGSGLARLAPAVRALRDATVRSARHVRTSRQVHRARTIGVLAKHSRGIAGRHDRRVAKSSARRQSGRGIARCHGVPRAYGIRLARLRGQASFRATGRGSGGRGHSEWAPLPASS